MTDLNVIPPGRLETNLIGTSKKMVASEDVTSNSTVSSNRDSGLLNNVNVRQASSESATQPDSNKVINQDQSVMSSEGVDQLMDSLNAKLEKLQNYLRFDKDEDAQRMVIFIKDSETDEVIRQIPSQELLDISKNITKFLEMRQQFSEGAATPTGLITHLTA